MNVALRIGVTADYDPSFHQSLEKETGRQVDFIESRGVTGEAAAWIVIAGFAVQALPHVIDFVKFLLTNKKVKSIQLGELKIENPNDEAVFVIEQALRQRAEDQ